MEHGPCGSPHRLHPPGAGFCSWRAPEPAETANTESCFSRESLWQAGHWVPREPFTIVSKAWPQSRQTYSKIGMNPVYRVGLEFQSQ